MRTTIRMNEELARRAKAYAAKHDQTFTQVVEEAIADYLARQADPKPRRRIVLPTAGDPSRRMTEQEYRQMIEGMYEAEAARVIRGPRAGSGR